MAQVNLDCCVLLVGDGARVPEHEVYTLQGREKRLRLGLGTGVGLELRLRLALRTGLGLGLRSTR